jgi:hypothetical protein
MKMMNRRTLLTGAALGGLGLAVAGCSSTDISSAEASWASVLGNIQSAVATATAAISSATAYIPTIESIVATAANLFGPQYAALVTIGSAAFNQIVATLTNVVNSLVPVASAHLAARLQTSSPNVPVTIGRTSTGVVVHGYKARLG